MGLALGGVAALAAGLHRVLRAGSDLNETINKIGVIFGAESRIVVGAAEEMAAKFGVVKTTFMNMASEYGNILQQMGGMTKKESAEMSVLLGKAAADASSIFNTNFEESADKIMSAILGMSRPISSFGVDVHEAAVEQEALSMGFKKTSGDISEQAKVAARAALVLRGLGVASGDLQNTIDGFANAARAAEGRTENLAAMIGQKILPAFEDFQALINQVLIDFTTSHDGMESKLQQFAAFVKETVATLGVIYRNWSLIVQYVGIEVAGVTTNIGEVLEHTKDFYKGFADWLSNNWLTLILDVFARSPRPCRTSPRTRWTSAPRWARGSGAGCRGFEFNFTPVMQGFTPQADAWQMPQLKLSSVADQLKEVADQMAKVEQQHADDVAKAKTPATAAQAAARPRRRSPRKRTSPRSWPWPTGRRRSSPASRRIPRSPCRGRWRGNTAASCPAWKPSARPRPCRPRPRSSRRGSSPTWAPRSRTSRRTPRAARRPSPADRPPPREDRVP